MKIIGSILIVIGCTACGFLCAIRYKTELALLRMLSVGLAHISAQLEHKLLPLPSLLEEAASVCTGKVSSVFGELSDELETQSSPDVKSCMNVVLERRGDVPDSLRESLVHLSYSLGKFDLPGQLQGIAQTSEFVKRSISMLEAEQNSKSKLYKTLGLCAGLALAIVLI